MSAENAPSSPVTKSAAKTVRGSVTIVELGILALYPLAIFLGFLVQLVGGDSPSYFSNKRNIINVYIIKRGWLWVTLVTGYHAYTIHARNSPFSKQALRNLFIRYTLATIWWIFFTQWFFGLPIMDKIFVITGGGCSVESSSDATFSNNVSSATCRHIGGSWTGGYDPSGHTFLITHSSLFLWNELLPYIQKHFSSKHSTEASTSPTTGNATFSHPPSIFKSPVFKVAAVLIFLFWWMLLMTGVYFHSILEKIFGLAWGYIEVLAVFFFIHNTSPDIELLLAVIPV